MEKKQIEELIEEKIKKHEDSSVAHSDSVGAILFLWLIATTAILLAIEVFPHIKII